MGICDPGLLNPAEEATPEQMEYWEKYFIRNVIQYPGRHLLEIGKPESGKTQFLYYCIDNFREYSPDEAILYFDIGKGDEILSILYYCAYLRHEPATIVTLPGCEIDIHGPPGLDLDFVPVARTADVWDHIIPGQITIASFAPFIEEPLVAVEQSALMYHALSHRAHRRQITAPATIIQDEFQNLCPAPGYGYAGTGREAMLQTRSINLIRQNAQKLRAMQLRLLVTIHDWTQLHPGVRSAFEWMVLRRGSRITSSTDRLSDFNGLWRKIQTPYGYLVLPDGTFSSKLKFPHYKEGNKLGYISYDGVYEPPKPSKKKKSKKKSEDEESDEE